MPPRFAYWTLLIDNGPTAFRARDAADLLPTLHQLKRKNPNVVLKWFSGGRLWDSPEAATEARRRRPPPAAIEKRGPAWRPGGKHADPRDRFRKKKDRPREERVARPVSSTPRPLPRAEREARRPVSSTPRPLPSAERATRPGGAARPFSSTRRPPPRPPRRNGPPTGRGGPRRTK